MAKKNTVVENVVVPEDVKIETSSAPVVAARAPEKMADVDRLSLDLAKANRKTALAEAQTALAKNDNAELAYKYVVLQIYMKYGLTEADAITEAGEILRGGAQQVQKA